MPDKELNTILHDRYTLLQEIGGEYVLNKLFKSYYFVDVQIIILVLVEIDLLFFVFRILFHQIFIFKKLNLILSFEFLKKFDMYSNSSLGLEHFEQIL